MKIKKFGTKYIVRIDKGEEIVDSIKKICIENNIKLGTVSGIGATNNVTVGLFDVETKEYHSQNLAGNFEITSLIGNISTMNGEVYLHLHITLGDEKHACFGGHLNSAIVSATAEIFIDSVDAEVDRKFDEEVGLNLLSFE